MNLESAVIDATPATPAAASPEAPAQVTPAEGAAPAAPFLVVNDRQSYATREEAIKGIDESGKRIAELTPWGEFAGRYQLKEPKELEDLISEYIDLKRAAAAPPPAAPANSYESMANEEIMRRAQAGDAQAEGEWQSRYFKQMAEKLGYARKEDVESKLTEVQKAQQAASAQAAEASAMQEGQLFLVDALAKAGVAQEDADTIEAAHSAIENWIVKSSYDARGNELPNSLRSQFFASADGRRKVIDSGVQRWLKTVQGFADKKNASAVAAKTTAMAAAPKPLPAGSTAPSAAKKGQRMDFDDPEFKREVREMFVAQR